MNDTIALIIWTWGVLMTGLYFRERVRSRDYATDLSILITDYDLTRDDLYRSLKWDEIAERVEDADE